MFLSDAQDDFRAAEIAATNAAAVSDPKATFRTSEIVAQNAAASSPLPRYLMAVAGLFLLYKFVLKGMK